MLLTGRTVSREFMDDPDATRHDLSQALRYLRFINRRLGGTAAALKQFRRWSASWRKGEVIRVLDLGTGSADIPLAVAHWADRAGFVLHITAVDAHPLTVDLAREYINLNLNLHPSRGQRDRSESSLPERSRIDIVHADALKLIERFSPNQFDYAHAGLFLHHLHDVKVMTVLRIMDRLAKRGWIWNDLVRSAIGRIGVRLLTLSRRVPAHVRHDAVVSVQAGFTSDEAIDLAQRAGCSNLRYRRHLFYRFALVSDKD